jgi:CheY-like chemotaxis protein
MSLGYKPLSMEKLKDKVVLIVDDEDRNTFALSSYLEAIQMKIKTASNGEEAIALLENTPIDIILLDMMMPVMDGYETLSVLKHNELFKNIPIIAVTAKAMKGDKEKCMEAGAWDYISKPLDMKMLIDKLIRWVI